MHKSDIVWIRTSQKINSVHYVYLLQKFVCFLHCARFHLRLNQVPHCIYDINTYTNLLVNFLSCHEDVCDVVCVNLLSELLTKPLSLCLHLINLHEESLHLLHCQIILST